MRAQPMTGADRGQSLGLGPLGLGLGLGPVEVDVALWHTPPLGIGSASRTIVQLLV
jgi:hypothetical protein